MVWPFTVLLYVAVVKNISNRRSFQRSFTLISYVLISWKFPRSEKQISCYNISNETVNIVSNERVYIRGMSSALFLHGCP